jgi:hypothetical protein
MIIIAIKWSISKNNYELHEIYIHILQLWRTTSHSENYIHKNSGYRKYRCYIETYVVAELFQKNI